MVKAGDAVARAVWAVVREDPVVAARVRGALAGLKAEYRGHRDEAMWLLWINRAQRQLTAEPAVTAEPAAPAVTAEPAAPVDEIVLDAPAEAAFTAPEVVVPRPQSSAPVLLFQEPTTSPHCA